MAEKRSRSVAIILFVLLFMLFPILITKLSEFVVPQMQPVTNEAIWGRSAR